MTKNQTSVLIAGAGPTGLVLALWLKRRGINFRIIDKSTAPGTTSRAIAVQARTLEFYKQLGIADQLIEAGTTTPQLILRRKGKIAAVAKFGALGKDVSPFPYLLFCSQDVHEALLVDLLKQEGVEIERQTELIGFEQNATSVTAHISKPKGKEIFTADYLCGCDGAHSIVRHQMPTEFPGGAYSQVFFVADVQATGEMAGGGVQISVSKKDFCIVMPIKTKGSIRLIGIVPPESEAKTNIIYEDVAHSVQVNSGLEVQKVNWFSSYSVHHRVAVDFQNGRVFISGDAGHIHSPAGGQGMNTGIGDAINLAWKLAEVIQGNFEPKLLQSYHEERHAFAKILIQTTDQAFKVIASRGIFGSFFRTYIMPEIFAALTRVPFFLKIMFRTVSQVRINYRGQSLSQGQAGDIVAGDRLPWVKTLKGDNYDQLKTLSWQIHIYGDALTDFKNAFMNIPIIEYEWNAKLYQKGFLRHAAYLIRPDGHVAFAIERQDPILIKNYLMKIGYKQKG